MKRRFAFCLTLLAGACTAANPEYLGGQTSSADGAVDLPAISGDGPAAGDGTRVDLAPSDLVVLTDIVVGTDAVPVSCTGDPECDDQRPCTTDRCVDRICVSTLQAGWCVIDQTCRRAGEFHPDFPCRLCVPAEDAGDWTTAADGDSCVDDGVDCTEDRCLGGQCLHQTAADRCLIDGNCYEAGQGVAGGCQLCQPSISQQAWTVLDDGDSCEDDQRDCTADRCLAGRCRHPVVQGCLVSDTCYAEGESGGACFECIGAQSRTALTFVEGLACTAGSGVAGMCVDRGCRSWHEYAYEPVLPVGTPKDTWLRAVAPLSPSSGEIWVAGGFNSSNSDGDRGMLLRLDSVQQQLTLQPMLDLHHGLAVGEATTAHRHDGQQWLAAEELTKHLAGTRLSVAGLQSVGELFFLGGVAKPPESEALYRCQHWPFDAAYSCAAAQGFTEDAVIGGLFAARPTGLSTARVWAIDTGDERDIYFHDGALGGWSTAGPEGCADGGASGITPCSAAGGALRAIYGTGTDDVWVVGSEAILLSYDGVSWLRWADGPAAGDFDLDTVYSSDTLVTVVGHRDGGAGREVVLYNLNRWLQRWIGPIVVRTMQSGSDTLIFDIDGQSHKELWMVGQIDDNASGGGRRLRGWVLRLQ